MGIRGGSESGSEESAGRGHRKTGCQSARTLDIAGEREIQRKRAREGIKGQKDRHSGFQQIKHLPSEPFSLIFARDHRGREREVNVQINKTSNEREP